MADHPGIPAAAIHAANAGIHVLMDQAITDDMFRNLLEGAIVWEDSDDLVPVADEAQSLDELAPAQDFDHSSDHHEPADHHAPDEQSGSGE